MNRKHKLWLLALALVLSACHHKQEQDGGDAALTKVDGDTVKFLDASQANGLQTAEVTVLDHARLDLPGRLSWNEDHTVRVFSPVAGRVIEAKVQPGDRVKAGATLAVVTAADFGNAQADYRKALAAQQLTQKAVQRARDLNAHGIVAAKDLEQAESDAASADAETQRAQARLKSLGDGGNAVDQHFHLTSPIDGVVVEKHVNPGQELTADQSGAPVFVVTDPTQLWVKMDAHENDLANLKVGSDFQITLPDYLSSSGTASNAPLTGRLDQIADFIDPSTRSVQLRGSVTNLDRRLKAEMFVTASFVVTAANAQNAQNGSASASASASANGPVLQIPSSAVLQLGDHQFVFVAIGDNRFRKVPVNATPVRDGMSQVTSGLETSNKVVTKGALFLQQLMSGVGS